MKPIVLALLLGALAPFSAYAGGESHGGQVVVCPGKPVIMLDYYQATLPTEAGGAPELVDLSKMSSDDVLALFKSRLGDSMLLNSYDRALQVLGPVDTWLEGNLQAVPDSDPAYTLPPDCSLQQVAVRQDSTMYVDPAVAAQLSPAQMGILRAHEALYYIAQQNGLTSSVEVRMVIRSLLMKNEDIGELSKAVHEMGSQFFWWEDFIGNIPYATPPHQPTAAQPGVQLQLLYDPMSDGDQMQYSLLVFTPNTSVPLDTGTFVCDNGDWGACHTVTGPHQCTIQNFSWESDTDNSRSLSLELKCTDINLDVHVTATKAPSPSPQSTTH